MWIRPNHRPDNVDRLDILAGTEKMPLQNLCLFTKLKVLVYWIEFLILHTHAELCFLHLGKSGDLSNIKHQNKGSSDGNTSTRRHPYINFMKSSSDDYKVDVRMSP